MLEQIIPWLGQASFFLSACAWAMRNIVWLRVTALASGALGITYNAYLASHADPHTAAELWKIVGWLALFFAINTWQSTRLIVANIEVRLDEQTKRLGTAAFPRMHSRRLAALHQSSSIVSIRDGDTLVSRGEEVSSLWCVRTGALVEVLPDGQRRLLPAHSLVGEASWVIAEQYGGSPGTIIAKGDTTLWCWPYPTLDALAARYPDLREAIADGVLRGMIKKRQFLANEQSYTDEPTLSPADKRLHAAAFPNMRLGAFALLLQHGVRETYAAGEDIDNTDRILAIDRGEIKVRRADGHQLQLGPGRLVGDIAFACRDRIAAIHCTLTAQTQVRAIAWSMDDLEQIAKQHPGIYADLLRDIGRELAVKLTLPLEPMGHENTSAGKPVAA